MSFKSNSIATVEEQDDEQLFGTERTKLLGDQDHSSLYRTLSVCFTKGDTPFSQMF